MKLINLIADQSSLSEAVTAKVIEDPDRRKLGEAIYSFRNSIVHGKYGSNYALHSGSVLSDSPQMISWRRLLRSLALKAFGSYGSKFV